MFFVVTIKCVALSQKYFVIISKAALKRNVGILFVNISMPILSRFLDP